MLSDWIAHMQRYSWGWEWKKRCYLRVLVEMVPKGRAPAN
jgi:hypothetical protein